MKKTVGQFANTATEYDRMSEAEQNAYNQGSLDMLKSIRDYEKFVGKARNVERQILGFLLIQRLCEPCKKWIREFRRTR